jgi:tetratricopeptide (TPR) repeat protein
MISQTADDERKEAFALYNSGQYAESLAICTRLLDDRRDPALEILAATNLFWMGKSDDAEVHFRDLAQRMPESSHVHSYLGKVLQQKNDENALAEFALAARLDPTNQDALRSYAAGLVARHDDPGALPALREICRIGKRPDDFRDLISALTRSGHAEEACQLCEAEGAGKIPSKEYAEALHACGRFHEAAEEAKKLYYETCDPAVLKLYLNAYSRTDPTNAVTAYVSFLKEVPHPGLLLDYTLLLQERGETFRALTMVKRLIALHDLPQFRLIGCELSAAAGDHANALREYETLIRDELKAPGVSAEFRQILRSYLKYVSAQFTPGDAQKRFLALVSEDTNVICLEETARMFHEDGDTAEAGARYYRAYRADYLTGGLAYARFLASCGDFRECEKVLLHILANVKKSVDISRVAAAATEYNSGPRPMKRLTRQLIRCLEERRQTLTSGDRECLAAAYRREAMDALSHEDHATCMYNCLCGIEVLPPHSPTCRAEDFLTLISRSKEQMVSDIPVIPRTPAEKAAGSGEALRTVMDRMALSVTEQKIVTFLATHKRANETDLRRLLGTRRAAGMVNMLIRKARAQGIMLVEKKGMSAEGEVYDYCGP